MTRLHDENGMVHDGPINTARFILSCPVLSCPFLSLLFLLLVVVVVVVVVFYLYSVSLLFFFLGSCVSDCVIPFPCMTGIFHVYATADSADKCS